MVLSIDVDIKKMGEDRSQPDVFFWQPLELCEELEFSRIVPRRVTRSVKAEASVACQVKRPGMPEKIRRRGRLQPAQG